MGTSHKLYIRYVRSALRSGEVAPTYPFEGKGLIDETLILARRRMEEILALPPPKLAQDIVDRVYDQVPGLLARLKSA
jgi:hypothetical protein